LSVIFQVKDIISPGNFIDKLSTM